ncbi:hypothetical protein FRC17_000373 [Serendipita sp. 399]|nr:hypothetical protein FRC17_000373 [Serendipita sp. 399]
MHRSRYQLSLYAGTNASKALRDRMAVIYEENMKNLLGEKLDPLEKEEEWFHPHARILILRSDKTTNGDGTTSQLAQRDCSDVVAYGVFRFDTEENADEDKEDEVLYCYEIQISSVARRQGLGRELLELMTLFGKQYNMKKVILTCFKANTDAIAFYTKLGFTNDPICPSQWENSDPDSDEEEEVDYFILSKSWDT